jgi:PAS domain S-box-containing protein
MPENDFEVKLNESYSQYKELFVHAADCIYTIDLNGKFLTVNESFLRAMKCDSIEEVLTSNMSKWMTQESLEKAKKFIQEVITQEDYYNRSVEIEIIRKDGIHVWFEHKARPIKDNNNNIISLHGIGRDITEKKRLERELRKSEEKYRDLFENANDIIYIHDLKGIILNINKIGSEVLGATEGEIIGSNIKEWLLPQSFEMFEDRIRKIFLNQPLEQPVVIEVITKKGEHKWGEATTRLIKDGKKIVGVQGIARDITEKIKLQNQLKESEERYRELFENANDAMYTQDLEGRIITMNDAGLKIMGCTRDEMIGSNFADWITPETIKIGQDILERTMSGEVITEPIKVEIVTKKRDTRWVEFTIRLIKKNDKITGIHGIGRDITEKIRLQNELKESEEKYRDLFENAQDAMYILDNEINFLKINTIGIQILGCTKEEVIDSNISRWVTPESLKIIQERQQKRLSGDKVNPTDILEIVCKNGEHRWVEIRTRVIHSDDGRIEYHGIARDITENRLLKQELKQSTKQQKLLSHLLQGTRGGKTRVLILKNLSGKSYNANELATALNLDYKTVRHHLNVLIKNGIIGKSNDGSYDIYFTLNNMDLNLNE